MPTYEVRLNRTVMENCTVEVEADNADEAGVAELERIHEGCASASYQKQVDINQKLVSELAAAQARVAELERERESTKTFYEFEREVFQKETKLLAAAKAENIGNLQLIGGMDERIKELEADNLLALSIADKFANERDEMKVREQNLVAALEKAIEMITSEYCSHGVHAGAKERNEIECGPDNPHCYAQPFYQALKAHKGGGVR